MTRPVLPLSTLGEVFCVFVDLLVCPMMPGVGIGGSDVPVLLPDALTVSEDAPLLGPSGSRTPVNSAREISRSRMLGPGA